MPWLCGRMSVSVFPHHIKCVLSIHFSSYGTSPTRRQINKGQWLWSRRHRYCLQIQRCHYSISFLPLQRDRMRTPQIYDSLYLDMHERVMISICSYPFPSGNIWNDGHLEQLSNHADSHDLQVVRTLSQETGSSRSSAWHNGRRCILLRCDGTWSNQEIQLIERKHIIHNIPIMSAKAISNRWAQKNLITI